MKKKILENTALAKNKKAYHDYEILEKYEAGVVLFGDEVKSIKNGSLNLKGAFVDTFNEESFLNNAHVSRYKNSSRTDLDPKRKRKLLLHKKEIFKIAQELEQKGITAIPLEVYLKKGLIKITVGLCRGKKLYDKRESIKKRENTREMERELKKFRNAL
ncbi:MAG: SsrA-binding protein SmpB [Candidatus Gracilibacteria bacterium]|jgi:SsrA-binding protein